MHFSINNFRMVSRLDKSVCKKIVFRFAKMKSSHFLLFFKFFQKKKKFGIIENSLERVILNRFV
jgi:hypothetical protein